MVDSERTANMVDGGLSVELTAPNGVKYVQPTGLFIGGEWRASGDGGLIESVDPTYVLLVSCSLVDEYAFGG